jgi:hypothetical protein
VLNLQCDNSSCINPEHLELGTSYDNQQDKVKRNRSARGEKNGRSKLTEKQVLEILKDKRNTYRIAEDYGVSNVVIGNIKRKKSWRYLHENKRRTK